MDDRIVIYCDEDANGEYIAMNRDFFLKNPRTIHTATILIDKGIELGKEITEEEFWEIHKELNG